MFGIDFRLPGSGLAQCAVGSFDCYLDGDKLRCINEMKRSRSFIRRVVGRGGVHGDRKRHIG